MAAFSPKHSSQTPERATASFLCPEGRNITPRSPNANFRMKNGGPSVDFHQKNSLLKERSVSPGVSFEHKENDKDENQHCPKTPRSSTSLNKGVKNFMAPTISAASKTSLPLKKKVLAERNTIDCGTPPHSSAGPNQIQEPENLEKAIIENPARKVNLEKNSKESTKSPKIFDGVSSPDDSLPPYDPHVHYLSPRPEFLHYKPNPRLEIYLKDANGGESSIKRQLKFSFTFENNSSSEENEETNASEIGPPSGPKADEFIEDNSESDSSSELKTNGELPYLQPETTCEHHEINPSSAEIETKVEPQEDVVEREFGARKQSYSYSFVKPAFLHLVLAIASLSLPMTDTPLIFSSVTSYRNMSTPSFCTLKEEVPQRELFFIEDVENEKEMEIKVNATNLEEALASSPLDPGDGISVSGGGYSYAKSEIPHAELILVAETELPQSELEGSGHSELKEMEMEVNAIGAEKALASASPDSSGEISISAGSDSPVDYEVPQPELILVGDEIKPSAAEPLHLRHIVPITENTESDSSIEIILPEFTKLEHRELSRISKDSRAPVSITDDVNSATDSDAQGLWEPFDTSEGSKVLTISQDTLATQAMIGIFFAISAILGAILFLRSYKETSNNDMKNSYTVKSADSAHASSGSHSVSEPEMTGESYPVEMSSTSEKSARYSRDLRRENGEVSYSYETIKPSVVAGSSGWDSEGSPSYGSFTTYEILPTKQGQVEECIVTPVRRSSRIRKQMISI